MYRLEKKEGCVQEEEEKRGRDLFRGGKWLKQLNACRSLLCCLSVRACVCSWAQTPVDSDHPPTFRSSFPPPTSSTRKQNAELSKQQQFLKVQICALHLGSSQPPFTSTPSKMLRIEVNRLSVNKKTINFSIIGLYHVKYWIVLILLCPNPTLSGQLRSLWLMPCVAIASLQKRFPTQKGCKSHQPNHRVF